MTASRTLLSSLPSTKKFNPIRTIRFFEKSLKHCKLLCISTNSCRIYTLNKGNFVRMDKSDARNSALPSRSCFVTSGKGNRFTFERVHWLATRSLWYTRRKKKKKKKKKSGRLRMMRNFEKKKDWSSRSRLLLTI